MHRSPGLLGSRCSLGLEAEKCGLGLMDVMVSVSYSLASSPRFLADRTIGRAFATMSRLSVVCLSVVCDVLYCGETVRPSEKLSEGVNRKPGSKSSFLGSPPYFYFRFRRYGPLDSRFLADCTIGRAFGTMCRLSSVVVCRLSSVTLYIVAKRYVLANKKA